MRDEDESALADGPLELVVARICRALGLPADWAAENFPFGNADDDPDDQPSSPDSGGGGPSRPEPPAPAAGSRASPAPTVSNAFP